MSVVIVEIICGSPMAGYWGGLSVPHSPLLIRNSEFFLHIVDELHRGRIRILFGWKRVHDTGVIVDGVFRRVELPIVLLDELVCKLMCSHPLEKAGTIGNVFSGDNIRYVSCANT